MKTQTLKTKVIKSIISIFTFVLLFVTFFSFNETVIDPALAQVGGQCRFDQANCTWDAEAGAVSYAVTVVEVESGQTIKTETVAAGAATKLVFPVTANKTYRCDVAAANACGTLGPAGSASALCAAEGVATPAPSVAPSVAPTVAPTQPPAVVVPKTKVSCGSSCATSDDCEAGLNCLKIGNGDSYCAKPEYQAACVQNPTLYACCQAPRPTAQPTLPPSGLVEDTMTLLMIGLVIAVLGFGGVLLTARKRG